MFGCLVKVARFYEKERPMACHRCQKYGHMKWECKKSPRYARCGEEGHNGCHTDPPQCANCDGNYIATDQGCPEYENNENASTTYAFMPSTINILQVNLWKSAGVQDALYNDLKTSESDIILVQEPHYHDFNRHVRIRGVGPNFEVIRPKHTQGEDQDARICSCM